MRTAQAIKDRLQNENTIYRAALGEISPSTLTPNQRQQLINQKLQIQSRNEAASEELSKSKATQAGLRKNLATARNIASRYRELVRTGAVSEVQLLESQDKVDELEARLSAEEREGAKLEAKLVDTGSTPEVDLRSRIEANLRQISDLDKQISEAKLQLQYGLVKAPIGGLVFDISVNRQSVIGLQETKPLLQIVPQDNLQARVFIPNNSVGFVRVGQAANLSIDTFNSADFGRIPAKVVRVGSDALTPEELQKVLGSEAKGLYYPAILDLKQQGLQAGARTIPLQSGMALTADLTLRERRFINIITSVFEDKRRGLERLR